MNNYYCFGGRWTLHYAYVDCHNYLADSLFNREEAKVKFGDEFHKDNCEYRIIFCKVKKKHKAKFEKALDDLKNKMLLCGYKGYDEFCDNFMKWVKDSEEE